MVRLLITGETGFLWRRVAARALARGLRVRLLGRDIGAVGDVLAAGVARLVYSSSPSVTFAGRDHYDETEAAPYPRRFASVCSLRIRQEIPPLPYTCDWYRSEEKDGKGGKVIRRQTLTKKLGEDRVNAAARDGLSTALVVAGVMEKPGGNVSNKRTRAAQQSSRATRRITKGQS